MTRKTKSDFKANYEDAWGRETNPFYDNMHKLWAHVLLQAIADARCTPTEIPTTNPDRVTKTEQAQARYLFEDKGWGLSRLRELCELSAIPMQVILSRYNDPNFDVHDAMRSGCNVNPLSDQYCDRTVKRNKLD